MERVAVSDRGIGVQQDEQQGLDFMKRSAEQGYPKAEEYLKSIPDVLAAF